MAAIPTIGVMLSFVLSENLRANIIIYVVFFFISNGFGFALITIIKRERVFLKGKKVKIVSFDHKVDLDFDNYNPKKQFYPVEFFKKDKFNEEFIPLLKTIDEDEIYEIVVILNYYTAVIEDQFNQRFLVHTNNLKIIE